MELLPVFALGSILYGLTEILWRGWTHWTMLLCGGICFTLMYLVSGSELSLVKKWLLSTCIITTVEFVAGCIVNLRLHWQVWDYSSLPFNLLGQICPRFILMWFALSIPGVALCTLLHRLFTAVK
ncbi:MAG: hypothetical protein SPI09_02680 [Candidatus Limivicinus sp.]|nr:putative ABC transporter permease [Clostridiales bacterium]MCI7135890.1 putative ABC transporter permease [Clostridiales bacterium]MDY6132255.1 hypothetical protein [Candidatus Limivicinus sp.]